MNCKASKLIFLLLSAVSISQCGEVTGLSGNVSLTLSPRTPIVISSDLARGDDLDDIKAPWFLIGFGVKNASNKTLVLASMRLKVKTTDLGKIVTDEFSIDPSVSIIGGIECEERSVLAVIPAGQTFERLNSCDPTDIDSGGSTFARYEQWFIQNLPKSENFIYSAAINAEGFFLDDNGIPTERLVLSDFLITK